MTDFSDREKALENKFAHDSEMAFKIAARRNKLLGMWAADLMGLTQEEADAYAKSVVQADFESVGDEDVIGKVLGDLSTHGLLITEVQVRRALADASVEARRQLMGLL